MKDTHKLPLIVIVGPTASGKTDLAVNLAHKYNGEIICADSRTIYKYMDIGTAKPSMTDRRGIVHWGLDLIEPGEKYSVEQFKKYADKKIIEIRSRNHTPILVGGSGLYVDSVIFDYQFDSPVDAILRYNLQNKSVEELHAYCTENNINMPENNQNKRYLIRAIEAGGKINSNDHKLINDCIVVGITTEKEILLTKIRSRIEKMISDGVVVESEYLSKKYGWDVESMTSNIYRQAWLFINGKINQNEFIELAYSADKRLVKKQTTWFKRNRFIHWMKIEEIDEFISNYMNKLS